MFARLTVAVNISQLGIILSQVRVVKTWSNTKGVGDTVRTHSGIHDEGAELLSVLPMKLCL